MRADDLHEQQSVEQRAARAATYSLSRAAPILSARRRFHFTQLMVFAALGAPCLYLFVATPLALRIVLFVLFSLFTIWRLVAAAAAISAIAPERSSQAGWNADLPTYTILCPLHREANMVVVMAERLGRLSYPAEKLDIKIVLEADDAATIAAADSVQWPGQTEVLIVPPGMPRTKPRALNYALPLADGQFVTIYDAEDEPDPGQLRAALDAFANGGEDMGCVQAPLLIDDPGNSWLSAQFAAEYAVQFRTLMPFLSRLGLPLMLGGTSNHFRGIMEQAALEI